MAQTLADRLLRPQPTNLLLTYGGILRVVDTPSNVNLELGISELVRTSVSQTGVEVDVSRQINAEKPKVKFDFAGITQEVLEIILGRVFAEADGVSTFFGRNRVLVDTVAASPAGYDGYGLIADIPEAIASVFKDGRSQPLEQKTFATFDAAAETMAFAQGANGAFKFSDDISGYQKSYRVPQSLNNVYALSETEIGSVGMTLMFLDSLNYVMRFTSNAGRFVRDGAGINFSGDKTSVTYSVAYDGSTCAPYSLVFTGEQVRC